MKANYKNRKLDTYIEAAWKAREDEYFEECKRDIVAQLMAVCCIELAKEFGFGKKRLNRFKVGVECYFKMMNECKLFNKKMTTQDCIDYMRDKYGIDFDNRGY